MERKFLSLIMSIVLAVGLCPSLAFAFDDAVVDLQAGVAAIGDDDLDDEGVEEDDDEAVESDEDAADGESDDPAEGDDPSDPGEEEPSAPEILEISLTKAEVELSKTSYTYNGTQRKPGVSVSIGDSEVPTSGYDVKYEKNVNAGTAKVTVSGNGRDQETEDGTVRYKGSATATFTIAKAKASLLKAAKINSPVYNGTAKKPTPQITFNGTKLKRGTDYKLSYSSNREAGKAKMVITGKGNFTGTKTVKFTIRKATVANAKVSKIPSVTYSGDYNWPSPDVRVGGKSLEEDDDYELHYANNLNAGKAKVKIKGIGNYKGSKTVSFTIKKASLASATVDAIGEQKYTGGAIQPTPNVTWNGTTLTNGHDYKMYYSSNVNAGTAKVTVKGFGNFKGMKTTTFTIKAPAPVVVAAPSSGSGDTVYITNTGAKYHQSWCRYLSKSKIPISKAAAIARGYDACKVCRP